MRDVGALAWNLLVGAGLSFLGAWLVVALAARWARGPAPRLAFVLAAVPFAKVFVELARGVPGGAFFWMKLAGARQDLGALVVNLGVDRVGPAVRVELAALVLGHRHPAGAADVLAAGLEKKLGAAVPATAGAVLLSVGVVGVWLAVRRVVASARTVRRDDATEVARVRLAFRTVRVLVGPSTDSVPVAAGILRPVVFVPRTTFDALRPEELHAVVLHELAHHRAWDVVLASVVAVGRALLWFVPGAGALARSAYAAMERAADASAVTHGASPEALASALVRVAELSLARRGVEPLLAAFGGSITQRVEALLAPPRRASRVRTALLTAVTLVVAVAALRATTLGNP